MRKIVCSFASDTALNDVLVHALVCRIRNENAFQMYKRLFYCTHTHTHTHTLLMSLLFDQFDDAAAQVQMTGVVDERVPFTAFHASLHKQQFREWAAFWTL